MYSYVCNIARPAESSQRERREKKQEAWHRITQHWLVECAWLRSGKDREYEAWGCRQSHMVHMHCWPLTPGETSWWDKSQRTLSKTDHEFLPPGQTIKITMNERGNIKKWLLSERRGLFLSYRERKRALSTSMCSRWWWNFISGIHRGDWLRLVRYISCGKPRVKRTHHGTKTTDTPLYHYCNLNQNRAWFKPHNRETIPTTVFVYLLV